MKNRPILAENTRILAVITCACPTLRAASDTAAVRKIDGKHYAYRFHALIRVRFVRL